MVGVGRERKEEDLRIFFEPKSVAIVGASRTPGKIGNNILRNNLKLGYPGRIYPVNPGASEIEGLKSYPSVAHIPETVELAVIAVPDRFVLDVLRDCQKKAVRGVIVISSGFSEAGEEGLERQRELVRIASEARFRVIGPNTTGILNPGGRFTTTFVNLKGVKAGEIGFVAQTGMFAGMMFQWIFSSKHFGLSKVIGLGNKADVMDHDALDYFAQDRATRVVIMYLEGVKDGRRFLDSVKRLVRMKPLVVIKGGKTEAGAKAAQSHTGSLAGRDEIFEALFRQGGVIRVSDFEELLDYGKTFAYQPIPRGNRIAIVTLSGGAGVMATDASLESGLELAPLEPETLVKIKEKLPPWANPGNPLDVEPLAEMVKPEEAYRLGLKTALSDPGVDLALLIMSTLQMSQVHAEYVLEATRAYPQKPVAVCIIGEAATYNQLFQLMEDAKIPVFVSVRRAVLSLAALYKYHRFLKSFSPAVS